MAADAAANIAMATIIGLGMVISITGNVIIAYVLIKRRKILLWNRPTYQFILNLLLSDLVIGVLLCPFEFTRKLSGQWIFGKVLCKIIDYVEISAAGTAVISHALIAVDRYRSLALPHLPKLRSKLVRQLIASSWIVPAMASSPYLYMYTIIDHPFYLRDQSPLCTPTAIPIPWLDKLYEAVEFSMLFFFPSCVICWCYYHVIRRTFGSQCGLTPSARLPVAEKALRRSRKRVTKTACLIVIVFFICWSPTFLLGIWRIASGTESVHHGHILFEVSFFGAVFNEAANPIIYSVYDRNMNISDHIFCRQRVFNETSQVDRSKNFQGMNHRVSVIMNQVRIVEVPSR
ncbi:tachykinin-like peptides receptor 86C [Stylophora pistillata]|nr:tachykinin-like peptides receptor 86C [Stylophora pistillata]